MKSKLKEKKGLKKGFTLTELIVVIAIIAILAAVLIPSITGYIRKSHKSADMQEGRGVLTIFNTYLDERRMLNDGEPYESFADHYKEVAGNELKPKKFIVELKQTMSLGQDPVTDDLINSYKYIGKYYIVTFPLDPENGEITYVALDDEDNGIDTINIGENEDIHCDLATEHIFERH